MWLKYPWAVHGSLLDYFPSMYKALGLAPNVKDGEQMDQCWGKDVDKQLLWFC